MSDAPTIEEGSVWWTIEPSIESAGYGSTTIRPSRVKMWRRERGLPGYWQASAFNAETGKVDDDTNCTRIHRESDIGRTLFASEAAAWSAYLGPIPTAESIAAELEERAAELDPYTGWPEAAARVAALRAIAARLTRADSRALPDCPLTEVPPERKIGIIIDRDDRDSTEAFARKVLGDGFLVYAVRLGGPAALPWAWVTAHQFVAKGYDRVVVLFDAKQGQEETGDRQSRIETSMREHGLQDTVVVCPWQGDHGDFLNILAEIRGSEPTKGGSDGSV